MKKSEFFFNTVSVPVDAIAIFCAAVTSYFLRFKPGILDRPIIFQLEFPSFLGAVFKTIPFLLIIFAFLGLYNLKATRKFISEFGRVIVGISLGLLLIILLFFFDQTIFPSRFIILSSWGLAIIYVILGRLILKEIQKVLFFFGYGCQRLVVIKSREQPNEILQKIYFQKSLGYKVVLEIIYSKDSLNQINNFCQKNKVDEILQTDQDLPESVNLQLVEFSKNRGIEFSFFPNFFEVQRNAVEVRDFYGLPVISIKNTPLDGWGRISKRIFDIVVSIICLVISSPLFVFISLAIFFDSPGKIIYSAIRGGRGKDFKFYKFRSMFSHLSVGKEFGGEKAEEIRKQLWLKNNRGGLEGPFLKIKDDPRVTKVGRFLRKTKLDEIPQFWNVLKGDMSMVGPRAHVLDEVEKYRNRYQRMFSIKPGIFGLSQTAQFNWPDLPFEEEIRLNTFYIENWSLFLDLKILFKSFWFLLFGRKPKEDY